jgi:hypothetical protein
MEPANLNHRGSGDPLEQFLREPPPRIADHGFSTRVMAAVDVSRRRTRMRLALMIIGAAAGVAVAAAAGAFGPGAAHVSTDLQRSLAELAALAANPHVVVAGFVIIAAVVYVFRGDKRDASAQ